METMMPTAYKNLDFLHIVLVIDATGFTDLVLLICNSMHFSFPITNAIIQSRPYLA